MPTTVRSVKRQSRTKNERRSSSVEVERKGKNMLWGFGVVFQESFPGQGSLSSLRALQCSVFY